MTAMFNHPRIRCGRHVRTARRGFTMVDLIVAMGIVLILMALIMSLINKMRQSANKSTTASVIAALSGAVNMYYQNFKAYPGPISDETICGVTGGAAWPKDGSTNNPVIGITMSENLVLGLAGGLTLNNANPPQVVFARELVGPGPRTLGDPSTSKTMASFYGANDRITSYMPTAMPTWGRVIGNNGLPLSGSPTPDSVVPEYLDTFPEPMPILYYRAHRGATNVASDSGNTLGQYDVRQNMAYLSSNLGNAKSAGHGLSSAGGYVDPGSRGTGYRYNLWTFMASLSDSTQPRMRDGYVLIASGADRIYGTVDDIVSFGNVAP